MRIEKESINGCLLSHTSGTTTSGNGQTDSGSRR